MGIISKVLGIGEKITDIVDKKIEDKDLANQLKIDLIKSISENMLTGKGSSVTKITICALVSIVTIVGTYIFLFKPGDIAGYKDYALAVTPLIGILVGAYATGTTVQKINK